MNEKVSNIGRLWANSITGGFESLILNKDDLCGFHKLVKESFEADDILAQCDFEELFLDNIWFKKQPNTIKDKYIDYIDERYRNIIEYLKFTEKENRVEKFNK